MKQTSILIIDDEPDNFDVIEALLSVQDYQLHYESSGQNALAALHTYDPDLILLDVMMPGMDGVEVCRQIKAMPRWKVVPIIMVTALNFKANLALCLKTGADDFISKPVNASELRARVHSMLRIKYQYDDLQTLLKLREDMVKMVIHDLRNPLHNVLLGLEFLGSFDHTKEEQAQRIAQIYSSAQGLQGLIDDLLKMARIESGKVNLNYTEVDLCELMQSTISNFKEIAAKKNQFIISQFPEDNRKKISIDVDMMTRTLDNLFSNAIKFSPQNSQIIARIEFLLSGDAKIQIIDSGSGVSEALQQKIFEKYEIGTLIPGVSQIGLGLAFCKMVVEAHGGKISVTNNKPTGAIFEINLAS